MNFSSDIKNIRISLTCIFYTILLIVLSSRSFCDNHKLLELMTDIFSDYNTKNLRYQKVFEGFKELIASRYERGEENNYVDYYLFVSGIVQNRYDHLRSFLSTLNHDILPSDLKYFINQDVATKLAYARKLNRLSAKTDLVFDKKDRDTCQIKINNQILSKVELKKFPSGFPIFISYKCDKSYNYRKLQIDSSPFKKTYIQKKPLKKKHDGSPPQKKEKGLEEKKSFSVIFDSGLSFANSEFKDMGYYNFKLKDGSYAWLRTRLNYKLASFGLTFSKLHKHTIINGKHLEEKAHAYLFEPFIAFNLERAFKSIFLNSQILLAQPFIKEEGKLLSLEPRLELSSGLRGYFFKNSVFFGLDLIFLTSFYKFLSPGLGIALYSGIGVY